MPRTLYMNILHTLQGMFANRNVNQLAEEFHFSDPSHLMRFFKRETGKTFTQYLRDYQNGIYE